MTLTDRAALIHAKTKELVMRQNAAPHLTGIRARLNTSAIWRLEDALSALHIAQLEHADALIAEAEANLAATHAQISYYLGAVRA
jgi:hypothetical protein